MVALAGDSIELSNHDGRPGHLTVARSDDHSGAGAFDSLALGLDANHEAWLICEGHDRQVERIAELDQAHDLFAGGHIRRRAEHRVVGHYPDRIAVKSSKARHPRPSIAGSDFEE